MIYFQHSCYLESGKIFNSLIKSLLHNTFASSQLSWIIFSVLLTMPGPYTTLYSPFKVEYLQGPVTVLFSLHILCLGSHIGFCHPFCHTYHWGLNCILWKDMLKFHPLVLVNVTLLGNRTLVDAIALRWGHTGLVMRRQRQRWQWRTHKPRVAGSHQNRGGNKEGFLPRALGQSAALLTSLFWISCLQNCETIYVYYFKLPSLW